MAGQNNKLHHYLGSTLIQFMVEEKSEGGETEQRLGSANINCVLQTNQKRVSAKELAKLQQLAQQLFYHKTGLDTAEITDVYIQNISYLGLMSDAEFNPVADSGDGQKSGADSKSGAGKSAPAKPDLTAPGKLGALD